MKFGALSELSNINIASSGGIFFPCFLTSLLSDLSFKMAGEQSKGYSSLAQPNMLALQVTIIFVICSMRRVSNTDDPLHNVIFRERGRVPVE